jgi:hypothetical protein
MYERVLTESGQWIIQPDNMDLNFPRFARLVKSVLGTYSRYCPLTYKFNLSMTNSENFVFTDSFTHPATGITIGKPSWISSATPLRRRSNLMPLFTTQQTLSQRNSDLVVKDPTPFEYRRNTLYVAYPGVWDVKAQYKHSVVGEDQEAEVESIDEDCDVFFELLTAKFITALGRNRRAFTLEPLEIRSDADNLVGEGDQMWKDAKENLIENFSSFADAWD